MKTQVREKRKKADEVIPLSEPTKATALATALKRKGLKPTGCIKVDEEALALAASTETPETPETT